MGLWTLLSQTRLQSKLHQLAARVAASSLRGVVGRLKQDVTRMTPAEANGYVRARGRAVVRVQVAAVAGTGPGSLTRKQCDQLLAISLDIVTRHAIEQVRRASAAPRYRRAA